MNKKQATIHLSVIKRFDKKICSELYDKLLEKKAEVQNRPQASKQALSLLGTEKGGDQADLVTRLQEESQHATRIQRDNRLLEDILRALARMETGNYGICEITEECIEINRLYSIPWTTLSIEGAEEQEEQSRKFKVR